MIADIKAALESIGPKKGHAFDIRVVDNADDYSRPVLLEVGEGGEVLVSFPVAGLRDRFGRYAADVLADFETIPGDGEEVVLVVLPKAEPNDFLED